jgi:hypothetical protein
MVAVSASGISVNILSLGKKLASYDLRTSFWLRMFSVEELTLSQTYLYLKQLSLPTWIL